MKCTSLMDTTGDGTSLVIIGVWQDPHTLPRGRTSLSSSVMDTTRDGAIPGHSLSPYKGSGASYRENQVSIRS